ncbi:MAG TPA: 30S ribosomal protein S20 [Candidatus Paceibacterota bacterium]|nr:30S ribosomal protein S20 [Candidatus Paceibacterota bacterium]
MPKIKSAKKALRQNIKRRKENIGRKTIIKKALKEFKKLIDAKKKDEAIKALNKVYAVADKVAKTGVIKKNKSARIKSRAAKYLKKLTLRK